MFDVAVNTSSANSSVTPVQTFCERSAAREITYAHSATSRAGRALIRTMENVTGRPGLIRRCDGFTADIANGQDFWQVMVRRFGLTLDVRHGTLDAIPHNGPLVLVSNHPFGILDGLIMGHILSACRGGNFRIMANQVFQNAPIVSRVILPIDFSATREAQSRNLRTRAEAITYLKAGGAIGIFPSGTVSTSATPFSQAMDPVWRGFTARMIAKSGATVVPIWFEGQNSRMFQIASHLHYSLRMGLLVREFAKRVDRPVRMAVGQPIGPEALRPFAGDTKEMMDFLRRSTYELSPKPLDAMALGHEFEAHYKR